MYCGRILMLLVIFAFVQIQLRWRRDEVITHKPWLILWKGRTHNISYKTGTDFDFEAFSRKYGEPLIGYDETKKSFFPRDRTEVEIHLVVQIKGPALSFHRIGILINDKHVRILDLFVPYTGVSNGDMMVRFVLADKNSLRFHHYFDSVWNHVYSANATITVSFRSGIPNLYDTPWVYK